VALAGREVAMLSVESTIDDEQFFALAVDVRRVLAVFAICVPVLASLASLTFASITLGAQPCEVAQATVRDPHRARIAA
jgi:hypothetical protein